VQDLITPDIQITLSRRAYFSAAYRNHVGLMKGHNFILEATIGGDIQPISGMIVPIHEFDSLLKSIVNNYDHRFLNDCADFAEQISLELLGKTVFLKLQQSLKNWPGIQLTQVRLYESDDLWVDVTA
jgi:6-pyruvoyltetrahydropterin/6-carboxytetrahydropterin synthase